MQDSIFHFFNNILVVKFLGSLLVEASISHLQGRKYSLKKAFCYFVLVIGIGWMLKGMIYIQQS